MFDRKSLIHMHYLISLSTVDDGKKQKEIRENTVPPNEERGYKLEGILERLRPSYEL